MHTYQTPSEAYLRTLEDVLDNSDYRSSPRGQPIREKLNYQFTIKSPSSEPLVTHDPQRNQVLAAYTKAEFDLYARGARTADEFSKASKFWNRLQNPDGTVNSAYGHLIFYDRSCGNPDFELPPTEPGEERTAESDNQAMRTPWEWARLALITDKDSRQALVKFHKRSHLWLGNKDQVCTLSGIFHIRNDALNLCISMRSNDLFFGAVFDLPWFQSLQERMLRELAPTYPTLTMGSYTHFVNSIHIYDRDIVAINKMLGR